METPATSGRGSPFQINGGDPSPDSSITAPKGNKPRTYISRLVVTFQECLDQLGGTDVTDSKLESMSNIIHECMSSGSRNYHSVQHVFDVSKNITDPIGIIAALFHDTIYYHVDGGLSSLQMEMLDGVFNEEDEDGNAVSQSSTCSLNMSELYKKINKQRQPTMKHHQDWCVAHSEDCCTDDPLLCMVVRIFGYEEGQEITTKNGINEFLSAVVAV